MKVDYDALIEQNTEDAHVYVLPDEEYLDVKITKDYPYELPFFKKVLYFLVMVIMHLAAPLVLFFAHGLVVKGRRNLKEIKNTGAISISNHVLYLDGVLAVSSLFPRRVVVHSQELNFKIPYVRHIFPYLGVIPIPESITAKANYIKATDKFLSENKVMHFNPEASLWPGFDKIRQFKPGAFHFAVKNNVPVIPICINFRKARGIVKFLPIKENLVTVHIGKPLYANTELPFKEAVEDLTKRSHKKMVGMNKYFKVLDNAYDIENETDKETII
jgi:1-acyl-sn-glycerol-3-phosphate acyltransferase